MATKPCSLNKAEIERRAELAAERLEFVPGSDIHKLVTGLGHTLTIADVNDHPESLEINADGSFTIFLPVHTSVARDRFTIAHELGHYFLHHPAGTAARYNRSGSDLAEVQANWFAASFLMPAGAFLACEGKSIFWVARKFGVSVPAAKVRAQTLKIVLSE
jgi:predicted transcriptional regulator